MTRLANLKTEIGVLELIATLYPWTEAFHLRPVRDYAFHLYDFQRSSPRSEVRVRAFANLLNVLRSASRRAGLREDQASTICEDFNRRPVLQTGPHLLLISEPEAYYSHIFSLLGLAGHGAKSYVSYAVSTVNLVERARKGPGWATIDDGQVNLFGLSRSQMTSYSLLAGPGRYRLELASSNGSGSEILASLRNILPTRDFERPAHALKAANRSLWPELFGDEVAFLQIDDEDIADLVVDHLSDDVSWLRERLFEDPAIAPRILEELDKLAIGCWAGWLTRGTDFFWRYEDGKRLPLKLVDGCLINPANGRKAANFAAADVSKQLADRSLIPNLLLMFLVVAILPGVRVLGGSRHPIYYPLMRYVIVRALQSSAPDIDLRNELAADDRPAAWGHRVIECDDDPLKGLPYRSKPTTSGLLDQIGSNPLAAACGTMSSFVSDPLWQEFAQRLANGSVSPQDAEWAHS